MAIQTDIAKAFGSRITWRFHYPCLVGDPGPELLQSFALFSQPTESQLPRSWSEVCRMDDARAKTSHLLQRAQHCSQLQELNLAGVDIANEEDLLALLRATQGTLLRLDLAGSTGFWLTAAGSPVPAGDPHSIGRVALLTSGSFSGFPLTPADLPRSLVSFSYGWQSEKGLGSFEMKFFSSLLPDNLTDFVTGLGEQCKALQELRLDGFLHLKDEAIASLAPLCLRALSLSFSTVTDSALAELMKHQPTLEELNVRAARHIGDVTLTALANHASGLRKLNVSCCEEVSNHGIDLVLSSNCGGTIESLDLCYAPGLTMTPLLGAIERGQLHRLVMLGVGGFQDFSDATLLRLVELPVRHLGIGGTAVTGDGLAGLPSCLPHLEQLNAHKLRGVTMEDLTAATQGLAGLQGADFDGCTGDDGDDEWVDEEEASGMESYIGQLHEKYPYSG